LLRLSIKWERKFRKLDMPRLKSSYEYESD
jgi:hypothetical protein